MLQACINQDGDIDASLKALPIFLLASETFAVFAGHSYTLRLWVRSCLPHRTPPHATARHRTPPRATARHRAPPRATATHRRSPPYDAYASSGTPLPLPSSCHGDFSSW
jgi:hypothetical protein